MILDTSFFLDLIGGDEGAVDRARELEAEGVVQRVPAQVVYELYVGLGYTDTPAEEERLLASVLAGRDVVETTERIAARAGRIDGQLRREGERLAVSDLLIGATALDYEEPVLTRDTDDFGRVSDLAVETY